MRSPFLVLGIILIASVLYMFLKDRFFGNVFETFEMNNQPGIAALEIRQSAVAPPRKIVSSGPNPPSQAPPDGEVVVFGEPAARDPYADRNEASDAPENMRYPERAFRPAPDNDVVTIAQQGGIAGYPGQTSPQAYQKFQTEFVQNSGEFMDGGVYANDTMSPTNFSAF